MKNRSISFADVLKRKEKGYQKETARKNFTLSEMLEQFLINPNEEYTLFLDQSSVSKSRISQQMGISKTTQGQMFDSWIQKQAMDNKENNDEFSNRYANDFKQGHGGRKAFIGSKGRNDNKYSVGDKGKGGNSRFKVNQVELILSKQYSQGEDQPQSYRRNKELSIEIQHDSKRSIKMPQSNSFRTCTMDAKSLKQPERKEFNSIRSKKDDERRKYDKKMSELQAMQNETENMHEQIAEMAHHYVLEDRQQRQQEDEELLISQDDEKKLILKNKSSSQSEKNQTRNEVGQSTRQLPSFGSRKTSFKEDEIRSDKKNSSNRLDSVGYSFAQNMQIEQQKDLEEQQIPMLQLHDAPTIPLIQEIASERNHSEANEEFEDMYSKWRQEKTKNSFVADNVQNIESVAYYRAREEQMNHPQNEYPINEVNSSEDGNYRVFEKKRNSFAKASCESLSKYMRKSSAQKPEIVVNIPLNYSIDEEDYKFNKQAKPEEVQIATDKKIHQLCLSQSPRKLMESVQIFVTPQEMQHEEYEMLTKQGSKEQEQSQTKNKEEIRQQNIVPNSPPSAPNREIYLSSAEPEQQEASEKEAAEILPSSRTQVFAEEDKSEHSNHSAQSKKLEEKHVQSSNDSKTKKSDKAKQSPANNHYALNKVYSNAKSLQQVAKHQEKNPTSQFETKQAQENSMTEMLPVTTSITSKGSLQTDKQVQSKEKQGSSKGKSSGKKVVLIGSNKSKQKVFYKIESYAHTTMFSTDKAEVKASKQTPKLIKDEQEEQFNFDF